MVIRGQCAMVELTLEIVLLILAAVFSFFGAIFGFLRWRVGIVSNVNDHERVLRDRHVHTNRAYSIPMPPETGSGIKKYVMELENPTCIPDTGWRYRIKSTVFGASGHTTASLRFTEVSETGPSGEPLEFQGGVPDVIEEVIDHPWYEDLGVILNPPFKGNPIEVRFKTTDPDEIESILSTLTKVIQQINVSKYTKKSVMVKLDDDPEQIR